MAATEKVRIRWWQAALLAVLISMLGLFYSGLGRNTSFIPSPLIGNSAPQFELPRLSGGEKVAISQYQGKPVIVNFWASWCTACRQEHALLLRLGRKFSGADNIRLVGVNYKDSEHGARRFQESLGAFPYPSAVDRDGRVGLDYGVYGLPETFFLDAKGSVIGKHIGPLTEQAVVDNLARVEPKQ